MDWDSGTFQRQGQFSTKALGSPQTNNGGTNGMQKFTFNTGGLNLTSGNDYVAFISASEYFDASLAPQSLGRFSTESTRTPTVNSSFLNNGNLTGQWTSILVDR
ncbi:MAG: hypothetical protein R3C20_20720 [Planctomycetaceae bacterium]